MPSNSRQPELQSKPATEPDPDRNHPDSGNVQPPDVGQFEETAAVEVQAVNAAPSNEGAERDDPRLRKAEETLDLTMKEFLNVLKNDIDTGEVHTPLDSEPNSEQQIGKNNVVIELINSVIGLDEESRSRQRILTFAARRYASALERNPEDYDAFYNWALVLQV
ncbi:hypothetical protein CDL12_16996 [Handroanthus impetiginosus]|uniref:Uncharacterized protein n=1 Tax=Handroanthus impetiginosus TaxID=429701 RepID=A0A2G9GYQ8_9LAMI|nr:hypothetical protein CDL12_16996 [Handroanthus impetiginosus]